MEKGEEHFATTLLNIKKKKKLFFLLWYVTMYDTQKVDLLFQKQKDHQSPKAKTVYQVKLQ